MWILLLITCLAESAGRQPSFYGNFIDMKTKNVSLGNNYFYQCIVCRSFIQKANIIGHYKSHDGHEYVLEKVAASPEHGELFQKLLAAYNKRRKYFKVRHSVMRTAGRGTRQAGAGQAV